MATKSHQTLLLEAVFDHLVLPPKLPAAPEDESIPLNWDLIARLLKACKQMKCHESENIWDTVESSLLLTQDLNRNPVSKETLLAAFAKVAEDEANGWLVIHVVQQNASIIIHRTHDGEEVVFEAFEASATASAALDTNYALQWNFPSRAVAISTSDFSNISLQDAVADFMEQACEIAMDQFAGRAHKGEKLVIESRDAPSPALVVEMFMSFLEATGRPFTVHAIQKRVRDDVVLGSAETPWRRSPYWLSLRVFIQRIMLASCDGDLETGRIYFKFLLCMVFAHLLADCNTGLHPEKTLMLQAKLCRRLAKLETEMSEAPTKLKQLYRREFDKTRPFFESILAETKRTTAALWGAHKKNATRSIPLLPLRASESDLVLKLSNSGQKLRDRVAMSVDAPQRHAILGPPSLAEGTVAQFDHFATQCSKLMLSACAAMSTLDICYLTPQIKCVEVSQAMMDYMDTVGTYYFHDAILMSQYLLNLFELWVAIDSAAVTVCPLLQDFHPVFEPEALDMLCFMTRNDMDRLCRVQQYICGRIKRCSKSHSSIFSDPHCETAFPASYLRQSREKSPLHSLAVEIEAASASSEDSKKNHLRQQMAQYERLSAEMQQRTCSCTRMPDGSLDVRGCKRCWHARCRKRLKIGIHESFLPRDEFHKAAILLELEMPHYLAAYRNATWRLRILGKKAAPRNNAAIVLADFDPLKAFQTSDTPPMVTLASRKKSFLQTHYRELKLPKSETEVLLPFGPVFTYYDDEHGVWADDCREVPWYYHLLGSWLPSGVPDPFAEASLYMDSAERPSSYEIAATQDASPQGMSSHEFIAYQTAISGVYKRWLVLLLELGSTNLNLSSEPTRKLFVRLALQSGPDKAESGPNNMRKVHSAFLDVEFCKKLGHQIRRRLCALESGRRDLECMSILVTLSLRLHHLCPSDFRQDSLKLLHKIRGLISIWTAQLREEVRFADNEATARKAASSALQAALLCRQTFEILQGIRGDTDYGEGESLHFFRASIALSENPVINLDDISSDQKQLLAQDMLRTYSVSNEIKKWTLENTSALETAINETWTEGFDTRSFSDWTFFDDGPWLTSRTMATRLTASQTIQYHSLQGHLFIDGKPLGRLPLEIRKDTGISELFKGQHLLTRPSAVAGMEYQIVNSVKSHEVHVGFRQCKVIIRAKFKGHLLEYVPREIFNGDSVSDLPSGLVNDCVHWLNLHTGKLEIRRKPNIWQAKSSNWILNVHSQKAIRRGLMRGASTNREGTCLVEPQSELGKSIMHIFNGFENPGNLAIFQPLSEHGRLSVEIKRLEMRFFVNHRGLLQSIQLQSEIDPVQNIGTLHGLQSKLVIRNTFNSRRKSVMVPFGPFFWQRRGLHVSVTIQNNGSYALFTVDTLLGRLSCAPEPALFYLKALIHALTSFPIPDELTGKTGTEEACLCLTAAQSQPWKPLNTIPKGILYNIIDLSPKREFYPSQLKLYQKVLWDNNLTATIQHEQLAIHAGDILRQSQRLHFPDKCSVEKKPAETQEMPFPDLHHLSLRGILRRQVYERVKNTSDINSLSQARDRKLYNPRGSDSQSQKSTQVYCSIMELRKQRERPGGVPQLYALAPMLSKWPVIDGCNHALNTLDVKGILSAEACQMFFPFISTFRTSDIASDYMTQLNLALFAFSEKADPRVTAWLALIGSHPVLRSIEPPAAELFRDFKPSPTLQISEIKGLILSSQDNHATHVSKCRENSDSPPTAQDYDANVSKNADRLSSWLIDAWPHISLTRVQFQETCTEFKLNYLNARKTWMSLEPELKRLSHNRALSDYITSLEEAVHRLRGNAVLTAQDGDLRARKPAPSTLQATAQVSRYPVVPYQVPCLAMVFQNCQEGVEIFAKDHQLPEALALNSPSHLTVAKKRPPISKEISMLHEIVQPFKSSQNLIQQQYGQDLEDSITAMTKSLEQLQDATPVLGREGYDHITAAESDLKEKLISIQTAISHQDASHSWLKAGYLWPCDSLAAILAQLCLQNYESWNLEVQRSLVHLGILVTKLQQALRTHDAERSRDEKRLLEEQMHTGHSNWNPMDYPEWLLLEIDNDILIRPLQVEVAKAIISPQSNHNSVLQMNMGTGKTSVVMPMAVLALADKTKLCRIIVPKTLLLQTAQVIQSRIGGLIGRQVLHVPFTRRSPSDKDTLLRYKSLHKEILENRGVVLCLPGHMLSFKLSGLQLLADYQQEEGSEMVAIQHWLDTTCRDILDESDLTLSVYTQLIYPSGDLTLLDGHPYRWLVVEELLSLVESHTSSLQKQFVGKIVVVQRHCGYPILYFLSKEPEDALNRLLIEDICNGRLPQLQLQKSGSESAQDLVRQIVSGAEISSSVWNHAAKRLEDETVGLKVLYLLRGLISEGILLLCLKKKWNIQYGLHPERQPIAVPFEAKGVPSQAAEYGHPDTALILTCLAFYQQGLSKEQVKQGLQGVMQSDDAAAHYDRWICSCNSLPPSLQYWNLLDPENDAQVETLWGYLKFDRTVINHHMNTYVFPRYAKQFSVKLQASGWDIPLLQSEKRGQSGSLTTGFSGTNDNKRILPQTVKQDDLPKLLRTNAEVLCHLLEPRNRNYYLAAKAGARLDEKQTLSFLREKKIRVLIDAGAHILEMENRDVAKAWLDIDTEAAGAIYFAKNGQITVLSRFKKDPMPLIASPFANDLGECVVYIDEGHTRGTDLKLPVHAKGAVTLSLGQTKDQTVQAAMRLRQLGTTQSVAFLAPPEVHQSILDVREAHTRKPTGSMMPTSADVVRWLLEQSCKANEQMMGLYFAQCRDFCRRTDILWKHPNFSTDQRRLGQVLEVIRQEEQHTLRDMYGARASSKHIGNVEFTSPLLQTFARHASEMARHSQSACLSALMEVEQEREVEFEVEQMREKQSKTSLTALLFPGLDPAVKKFVKSGELNTKATGTRGPLLQAFDYVGRTRTGKRFGVAATTSRLFISAEFSRTVAAGTTMEKHDVLRPVNWILWNPSSETALIIIPEEADAVIPILRNMRQPLVWLLGYAAPVTRSMQSFNSLTSLTVPAWPRNYSAPMWLKIEVGILSGRLFFEFPEYRPLLNWLGLAPDEEQPTSCTGLDVKQPLQFLQEWVAFRRRTDDIQHTPVGFVCQRQPLHEGHFFFMSNEGESTSTSPMSLQVARFEGMRVDDEIGDEVGDGDSL